MHSTIPDPSKRRRLPLAVLCLALLTALPATAQANRDYQASIGPDGLLDLDLETGASVEITVGGNRAVLVRSEIGADSDPVDIAVTETGRGVRVTTRPTDRRHNHRSRVKLFIEVPQHVNIALDSMGGGVSIDGVDGEIRGETMGGALRLRNLRGQVHLSTMGGDVELVDSEVDGEVSTMGGEVLLRDVVGNVDGSSMGGNVRMLNVTRRDGSTTGDAVIISTMGGRIDVDDAPAGAELDTMGGDIRVTRAERYVEARTMGGDIQIDEVAGWVEATTMGGDIAATVVAGGASDYHVELASMSGEVVLTLPRGLGFTFDVELAYTKNRRGQYRIDSDAPLEVTEDAEWSTRGGDTPRKRILGRGQVGDGAHRVRIATVNGNVTIRMR